MECRRSQNSQTELIRIIRENIKTKGDSRNTRINKDKIELTFQPGDLVLVRACNVGNAAAGKVAKFLSLYEGPYNLKKRIVRNTYILSSKETERERGQFHAVDLKTVFAERGRERCPPWTLPAHGFFLAPLPSVG